MELKIIDLHTHVLPGMDDGAADMAEALDMLRNAAASDVLAVAATPHCNIPGIFDNYFDDHFLKRLRLLRTRAEEAGIPVKIMTGMEVRATEDLPQLLRQGKLMTLNGSRYLLTEFRQQDGQDSITALLRQILAEGYIPLIAHPERYRCICKEPDLARRWLDMGCHLQLTGGSLLGKFGSDAKAASDYLLSNDLVACVASDAHRRNYRTNFLGEVYEHLSARYHPDYAALLLYHNPLRITQSQLL